MSAMGRFCLSRPAETDPNQLLARIGESQRKVGALLLAFSRASTAVSLGDPTYIGHIYVQVTMCFQSRDNEQ